jgi:hypothetical protein
VKYLVIHKPHDRLFSWNAWLPPVARFLQTYREVYSDSELIVLQVY